MDSLRAAFLFVLLVGAAVLAVAQADAAPGVGLQASASAPLRLGVGLYSGALGGSESPPYPTPVTTETGIRYVAGNMDGRGTGAGYGISYDSLSANPKWLCTLEGSGGFSHGGCPDLGPNTFLIDGSMFTSTASTADLSARDPAGTDVRIQVRYQPSASDSLYEVLTTVTNLRATASLEDVWYRAAIEARPEPLANPNSFNSFLTLDHPVGDPVPAALRYSGRGTQGSLGYNPLRGGTDFIGCGPGPAFGPGSQSPAGSTWFAGVGPCRQGPMVDIDLGDIQVGGKRSFRQYWGVAADTNEAAAALNAVQAEFWFLWQTDAAQSGPVFIWAFRDLSGPSGNPSWCQALPPNTWTPTGWGCTTPCAGRTTTYLSGAQAKSPATVSSVAWDWGDGTTGTGVSADHTYADEGEYDVTVTITDSNGATLTLTRTVTVVDCTPPPPPNVCPTIDAIDAFTIFAGSEFVFQLEADDGDVDAAGNPAPDTLAYALQVEPALMNGMEFSPTGRFTWTPGNMQGGKYSLIFTASDEACSATRVLSLQVYGWLDPVADQDQDGVADLQDNCPTKANRDQADADRDAIGDLCDTFQGDTTKASKPATGGPASKPGDRDGDGVLDGEDICPAMPDPAQADADGDRTGDACDDDLDGDGVSQAAGGPFGDNCPTLANADQKDADRDGIGDACDGAVVRPTYQPTITYQPEEEGFDFLGWSIAGVGILAVALVVFLVVHAAHRRGRPPAR